MLNKIEVFEKELAFVKNEEILNFTKEVLNGLPDYFFTIPASSSGRYHPQYALGEGGLVRHTKAAIYIALSLFNVSDYESLEPWSDLIISALILHDGLKRGVTESGRTETTHPVDMASYIQSFTGYNKNIINKVSGMVASHMGKWDGKGLLPIPQTCAQKFVHLCDYLASRKFLEVYFDKV